MDAQRWWWVKARSAARMQSRIKNNGWKQGNHHLSFWGFSWIFLWCSVSECHMVISFLIWIKDLLVTALTFRPRCTWAEWGPSCGAAAETGPDRCSAGTGLASAWTPGYETGCQLVVGSAALLEEEQNNTLLPSFVLTLRNNHAVATVLGGDS